MNPAIVEGIERAAEVARESTAPSAAAGTASGSIGAMCEGAGLPDAIVADAMRRRRLRARCPNPNDFAAPVAMAEETGRSPRERLDEALRHLLERRTRDRREGPAMGMFDHVTCEQPMPNGREVIKDSFQTKSLWCCMDHFTITAAGRLIFHRRLHSGSHLPRHVADIDLEYHGDIEMHGRTQDGDPVSYAVRFTHGAVEWIRPLDSLPEIHQRLLIERGS